MESSSERKHILDRVQRIRTVTIADQYIPSQGDRTFDGISIRRLCSYIERSYRSSKLYRIYFVSLTSYAFIDRDFDDQVITDVQYSSDSVSLEQLYSRREDDERHEGKDILDLNQTRR